MGEPSLASYLADSLRREHVAVGSTFTVQVVRSQPRKSHALFPHASNHASIKISQQEVLAVLNEVDKEDKVVPVCAIEAMIYSIPSTSSSIVYISKVDTTGLQQRHEEGPSPTKLFVAQFVKFHFDHPPNRSTRVRVHVFARSQPQYLFPASVDNVETKRVLDDKGLLRWWKSTLDRSTTTTSTSTSTSTTSKLKKFYLVAGLNYFESLPYVPDPRPPEVSTWTYGHPYSQLSSLLHPPPPPPGSSSSSSCSDLTDLIPSFPDDPKSRFLHSLTGSTLSPSGAEGDYDDAVEQISTLAFASGSRLTPRHRWQELERERERERERLRQGVEGGVDEWWERMQYRQECCSGALVGFFVIDFETTASSSSSSEGTGAKEEGGGLVKPYRSSLPHATFTKLWTQFHNQDYSLKNVDHLVRALEKWANDVGRLVKLERDKQRSHRRRQRHRQRQRGGGGGGTTTRPLRSLDDDEVGRGDHGDEEGSVAPSDETGEQRGGEGEAQARADRRDELVEQVDEEEDDEEDDDDDESDDVCVRVRVENQALLDEFVARQREKKRKLDDLLEQQQSAATMTTTTTTSGSSSSGERVVKVNTLAPRKKKKKDVVVPL
ncbi:hypothetical protein JCM3766R1_006671 [Sporobolomyces carnicolor]